MRPIGFGAALGGPNAGDLLIRATTAYADGRVSP